MKRLLVTLVTLVAALAFPAFPTFGSGTLQAQQTTVLPVAVRPAAVLSVQPGRSDWTYPLGTAATVRITVRQQPYPADGVPVRYRLGPDMREGAEVTARVPAEGLVLNVPAQTLPGFVRVIVKADVDGKPVESLATLGFAPEQIRATQREPEDFDAFWQRQREALARVPVDLQVRPAPELSNERVEVSHISFQNVANGGGTSRFHGVLAVPRKPGRFPALLSVPGAGVRAYGADVAMAERGFITLNVGIHGIPVNLPAEVYEQLARGALNGYPRFQLDHRDSYYYRRVYLGALRASEVLTGLPQWDGRNLLVRGGSQGGQLTLVVAALNPQVTALAADYPAYSDVTGYLNGGTGGWPHLFRQKTDGQRDDQPVEPKLATTAYYDSVNFARRVKVPGFYGWGYNDIVTPPTSLHAAYNVITAPRQLLIAPELGHGSSQEQNARRTAWLLEQAGIAPTAAP